MRPILMLGDAVLETPCQPVTEFDAELRELVAEMFAIMRDAHGVGISAPQIGVAKQLAVISIDGSETVIINPRMVSIGGRQEASEGCLSIPGFTYLTSRPHFVTINAHDIDGNSRAVEGEGLLARALMHEYEHLQGKLFIGNGPVLRSKAERYLAKRQPLSKAINR